MPLAAIRWFPTEHPASRFAARAWIGLPKKAALYTMNFPCKQRLTPPLAEGRADPMPITIKTPEEQAKMRVAGRLAADVLDMIGPHVVPGVTTDELDRLCHDFIVDVQHAIPANLNYRGFPKTICTSINHVVCHGIPNEKPLKEGDIVNIDVTLILNGWHGDSSRMYAVGDIPRRAERLIDVTYDAMMRGMP